MLALGIFAVVQMETDDLVKLRSAVQDCLVSAQEDSSNLTYAAEAKSERITFSMGLESNEASFETIKQLANKYRGGLLITAVIGMAAGLLLQIFASSFMLVLTTACLGTSMVLGGVWLGLTFRGQKPEELLGLKPVSSVVVLLVMLALGMLVQLTMTRKHKQVEPDEEEE